MASTPSAILAWLNTPCERGSEFDLRKAFDNVDHGIAYASGSSAGVPTRVLDVFRGVIWISPRFCVVQGGPPRHSVRASCGLPAGDPCSPHFLAYALRPWTCMMKAIPGIVPFLYMDDRSIVDANDDPALPTALATTQLCDARLGFKEHLSKRQTWTKNDSVEHLGLTVQHGVPSLPAGRASTDLLCELAQAVSGLPGNMEAHEAILLAVVLPKLLWSAPLVPAVEQRLVDCFLRACRGRCTWWCRGRVWADHVTLHPRFACAVKCLALAPAHWQQRCATLRAAVKHHASVLSLRVEPARAGLCLGPRPSASARVREVIRRVGLPRGQPYFDPAADDGHTLRMVARALALDSVNRNRWDSEGIDDVDLWVQADPAWTRWKASLSPTHRTFLRIWRGGAVKTRSRRWYHSRQNGFHHVRCECGAAVSSARHLFAECPRLQDLRDSLQELHDLPAGWFAAQPRITAKSGWVTAGAGPTHRDRVQAQIASCTVGIAIAELGSAVPGAPD